MTHNEIADAINYSLSHCGKARGYYPEKRKGSSSCDGRANIDGVLGGN